MIEYLQTLTWQQLGASAGAIAVLGWMYKDKFLGLFPSGGGGSDDRQNVSDLKALNQLDERAQRLQCEKLKAAINTCYQHFFEHRHEE